jgi:hypothetical protein
MSAWLRARYYEMMGIKEYHMRLSLPDLAKQHNFVDEPEKWNAAAEIIRSAMKESGFPYIEAKGEAAFYGPKVDFMIKSVIGTEYAISTNQLDFMATTNFNLSYIGEDGHEHPVYVIHRAPLGSHERFTAFLIEHYAGAPQFGCRRARIPISEKGTDYAQGHDRISRRPSSTHAGLRVDIDVGNERMQEDPGRAASENSLHAGCRRTRDSGGQGRRTAALGQGSGPDAAGNSHRADQKGSRIPGGCGRIALAIPSPSPILKASAVARATPRGHTPIVKIREIVSRGGPCEMRFRAGSKQERKS